MRPGPEHMRRRAPEMGETTREFEQAWLRSGSVRRESELAPNHCRSSEPLPPPPPEFCILNVRLPCPGEEVDIMPRISAGGFSDRIDNKICSQISCKIDCVLLKRYCRLCCKIALAKWNVTFPGIFVLDCGDVSPANKPERDINHAIDLRLFGHCRIRSVVFRQSVDGRRRRCQVPER